MTRPTLRSAFTLFEVMISLLVLTTAVLATASLMPIGLKAQQLARSQMFAASTAVSLMRDFHNPVPTFEGVSALAPDYNGVPGVDTTNTAQAPYTGWAGQLRAVNVHSAPFQYNAEQELTGWLNGVLPVPPDIARRLDSDNDDIQKLLDDGGILLYPDANFMQGFNMGAAADKTMSASASPEVQKMVFAFITLPQQNALSSQPVESWPWYEVYPFPPEWISLQARGRVTRRLDHIPKTNPIDGNNYNPFWDRGARSGVTSVGRGPADWSWWSTYGMHFDDVGHARYWPVHWGFPMRQGQELMRHDAASGTNVGYRSENPLDDPDASADYGSQDAGQAFYQGNGFYHGRNWRYFEAKQGGMWRVGNGLAWPGDPVYTTGVDAFTGTAYATKWAWYCFQRVAGADANFLGFPRSNYTNEDPMDNTAMPAVTVTQIKDDTDPNHGLPYATTTVSPSKSFPGHDPAKFHRSGWLPIRGLLTNPHWPTYEGLQIENWDTHGDPRDWDAADPGPPAHPAGSQVAWAPTQSIPAAGALPTAAWPRADTIADYTASGHMDGSAGDPDPPYPPDPNRPWAHRTQRLYNLFHQSGLPATTTPAATYEMRANYRDRAIDLWQAVMPANSGMALLKKNAGAIVKDDDGGTMVDCNKYEYAPSELDKFKFILPKDLAGGDWPIHPAQIMALSYLAHAAMMVTGYAPPFGSEMVSAPYTLSGSNAAVQAFSDVFKVAWEPLNWTYQISPAETSASSLTPATEVAPGQGVTKDALLCKTDALPGATTIELVNDTGHPWVIYPGDRIMLEPSYLQWYVRWGYPAHHDNNFWDGGDAHFVYSLPTAPPFPGSGAVYDPWPSAFPNLQYQMHTFLVTSVTVGATTYTWSPGSAPLGSLPPEQPGATKISITISPPLPYYPKNLLDARDWSNPNLQPAPIPAPPDPSYWDTVSLHANAKVRRIANQTDVAFARKAYEMCMQWAKAYASEFPNDAGAPRMANFQTMLDKPLTQFDLFWDAANGGVDGQAVRVPLNRQTSSGTAAALAARRNESFYRWMVPGSAAPDSWFYQGVAPPTGRHGNTHQGPGFSRTSFFDQMVHNNQLNPPSAGNDDKRFTLTRPFAPFHRARLLRFWSVDWKAYEDSETAPSAPIDFAKHDRFMRYDSTISDYSYISPIVEWGNLSASTNDGRTCLCGNPESLYVWTSPSRRLRYGDVVGGEMAGYLYLNQSIKLDMPGRANCDPPMTDGQPVSGDVHLGHWGADRNGNGVVDYGPVPRTTRMRAARIGDYIYYDPILRVNAGD